MVLKMDHPIYHLEDDRINIWCDTWTLQTKVLRHTSGITWFEECTEQDTQSVLTSKSYFMASVQTVEMFTLHILCKGF